MIEPNVTFFDFQGHRIFSIETPRGFVHLCDEKVFAHVADALRYIKGGANPVMQAMAEQRETVVVEGDVSGSEDDRLEE